MLTLIILLAVYVIRRAVIASLMGAAPVTVIPHILGLRYSENTGAAFSMLRGGRWIFIVLTIIVCTIVIWYLIRKRGSARRLLRVALSLILAGAIGNLIDRAFLGYVRDMLDFCLIHFPIFNVADSALTVGGILLVVDILFVDGSRLIRTGEKKNCDGKL